MRSEQHGRLGQHLAADDELLLVPAGQRERWDVRAGRADVELVDHLLRAAHRRIGVERIGRGRREADRGGREPLRVERAPRGHELGVARFDDGQLGARVAVEREPFEPAMVRFAEPQRLRAHLTGIPDNRKEDPHVSYFARANPGYEQGDELVCLAELSAENLTPAGRRMVAAGAARGVREGAVL